MKLDKITIESSYGITIDNQLITNEPQAKTLVVLFPGAGHSCDAPLLYYAREVCLQLGIDVLSLQWGFHAARKPYDAGDISPLVADSRTALQACLSRNYEKLIFIGKSMGTRVAGEIAKELGYQKIPQIFVTPLRPVIPHMLASRGLLIVGTSDRLFTEADLQEARANSDLTVHLVPNANHALEIDGSYRASFDIMAEIAERYEQFLLSEKI